MVITISVCIHDSI